MHEIFEISSFVHIDNEFPNRIQNYLIVKPNIHSQTISEAI